MAGYRNWTDEDYLNAAGINGYLMGQVVCRFASTTERDAQLATPVAGQIDYLAGVGWQLRTASGWVTIYDTAGASPPPAPESAGLSGVATLIDGTVTVTTDAVTPDSRIYLTTQSLGTVTVPSALAISDRTAAVSFTVLASDLTDTSVVAWHITEPA